MALLDDKGLGYFVGKLKDMFAPKSHTHDDRYYTESEIDGKLSGKANSSHTHTKAQVGLGNVDNTADSAKSVNYATSAGTANEINPNNSYGSITKAVRPMFDSVRANRLAFLPSDQIIIEKTVDGGKTWTDAAITDYNKRALFSENGGGFTLPQIDGKKNALCGIRLTITGMKYNVPAGTAETAKYNYWNSKYVKDTERYCTIGDMFFWVSGGADDISLVIERATGAASTSWANLFTSSSSTGYLEGWSGPNYIKFSESTLGGGTGQTSNCWNYRFTFMSHPWNGSAFNSNYITQAQNVTMIKAYGASVWTTPNNLMSNDHIYKWDVDENVAFPAIVSASGFNGTATKLARDGDLANPMTFNWKGKDGQPTWLWGGEDGGNMYVYNPSKFNVNSAKTAASADSAKKLTTNAGSATQPVYFSNGVPVAITHTLAKSVPADAKFTDTDTWRGIQNNLTSDSTTDSLSAAQGKALKGLVDGKAASGHTHDDRYYTESEIDSKLGGKANTNHSHSAFGKATADAAGSAGYVPAPAKGQQGQYLRGDGTWATPTNTTYGDATTSAHGLMTAADKAKLDGIASNANNYSHPTSSGNKHIPAGGSAGQILRWSADGTATWGVDNNTTYSIFKGASSSAAGGSGLVPPPAAGSQSTKYLRADGTWTEPPNTTYANATKDTAGLMTAADKTKLDGIATEANKYVHPTNSGYKHIPTGGAAGQILRWKEDGTATWGADKDTTYTNFVGATANASGKAGLVPAPSTGATNLFLRSDGTWGSVAEKQTSITIVRW
jgi:hypothetical protein